MNESLPFSAILDSSVVIAAFGGRFEENSRICAEFVSKMRAERRRLWIAAPTLAEINARPFPTPIVEGIAVVSFDRPAALILAEKMPHECVRQFRDEGGAPMSYYKFDSLIVACGLRCKAECLVSLDERQRHRSERAGLKAFHPSELADRQRSLPFNEEPMLKSVP